MIKLTNGIISTEITELGAELQSLKKGDVEYLWDGRPEYWSGRAPILFPICGGVADDKYEYDGKAYTLPKHGFARKKSFTVESAGSDFAVLLLRDDEETREGYPFVFELRARFALVGDTLVTDYIVTNKDTKPMPFSVGAHEAYVCPEGISEYELVFEKSEQLNANVLHGNLLGHETTPIHEGDTLALNPKYFEIDALVFTDVKSRAVTLRNKTNGRGVAVRFDNHPYLLIWQKCGAPYICIEPWCGIPDYVDSTGRILEKPGIIVAAPGETIVRTHTVRLI